MSKDVRRELQNSADALMYLYFCYSKWNCGWTGGGRGWTYQMDQSKYISEQISIIFETNRKVGLSSLILIIRTIIIVKCVSETKMTDN